MQRKNLYDVTVTVTGTDGKVWTAVFDKFSGGEVAGKSIKYRPGNALQQQRSLGSATEVSDVKVTRIVDPTVDAVLPWLLSQAGRAAMVVKKQGIDGNGAAYGQMLVYSGLLDSVTPPDTDSESGDEAALIELGQSTVTVI